MAIAKAVQADAAHSRSHHSGMKALIATAAVGASLLFMDAQRSSRRSAELSYSPPELFEWRIHSLNAQRVFNTQKGLMALLRDEMLAYAERMMQTPSPAPIPSFDYAHYDEYKLVAVMNANAFAIGHISQLIKPLSLIMRGMPEEGKSQEQYTSEVTLKAVSDPEYCQLLKRVYQTDQIDCWGISATCFAANFLYAADLTMHGKPAPNIELVTGLVFQARYAPQGEKHQYVKLIYPDKPDTNVDPSLSFGSRSREPEASFKYVPLVGTKTSVRLVVYGGEVTALMKPVQTIYCFPRSIERPALFDSRDPVARQGSL